jgi:hypothetical protein
MGEQTILVCDVCGKPAVETVTIRIGNRNLVKDYCSVHLAELTAGARTPRRGRRKGSVAAGSTRSAAPKRRGRPPKRATAKRRGRPPKKSAAAKRTTGKRRGRPPKATGKRRGRPPKASQAST